ncbi:MULTISPECIES: DUF6979 family protein [Paenibacillus]|uniref:DUF6979 family protein n=1 Tax=Paenibacillus TaxID=44249 RepID=UPI001354934C|nr:MULTISPECIES: hypothetical protein [Paenibacillus]MDY8025805.1 hypothetical protein [Paenibacillus polymyxa]MXO77703.1 hypothetical protein [Paenibacillus sp. OT2-17]
MENKYGQCAIQAIKNLEFNPTLTPLDAWEMATTEALGEGTWGQKKGCPKVAFIGLCEAGLVKGIPKGTYSVRSHTQKNKEYALKAIELLIENPTLVLNKMMLWKSVVNGSNTTHNSQMDVVMALWKNDLILRVK